MRYNHKEIARIMRGNCKANESDNISVPWKMWLMLADIIESAGGKTK